MVTFLISIILGREIDPEQIKKVLEKIAKTIYKIWW